METELKFALSPDAWRQVEQQVLNSAAEPAVETDETVYFDTPDRVLNRAGFSLRIRHRAEDNSSIQTMKSGGGAFRRREWEWPVAGLDLDGNRLHEVRGLPGQARDPSRLAPVFRTEVKRTRCLLAPVAGTKVELAFDEGAVVADGGSEPLSELEIELKEGSEEALLRLGLDLVRAAPLALLAESKAERGYHLADGTRPEARKPPPIEIDPERALPEAFRALSDGVVDHLLSNQPAALRGDDQEGIHQMRVAIRRMRSLLVLFERLLEPHAAGQFEDELRRLGQVLGLARDWDVFLSESLEEAAPENGDAEWTSPLRMLGRQRQQAAHQAAKKAILEPGFTRFVLAFRAWSLGGEGALRSGLLDRPARAVAGRLLSRLADKVERRLADADCDDLESLHSLRKSAKKLRYGIEYLQAQYGKASKRYYKRCNKVQKRLGRINDLASSTRLAGELAHDGHLDVAPSLGILASRNEALIARKMKKVRRALRRFEREDRFWR
jgi:triphosphatase